MTVSIDHPTDRPNFTVVHVGSLRLAFSYRTVVGYSIGWEPWILHENVWGPTTGKHLNWLGEKEQRIDSNTFAEGLNDTLAELPLV